MKVATKVITRSISTLTLDDDSEVVLEHEPGDDPLVERVGDKLVVAYLVSDADGTGNPMKEHDCQGHIYTKAGWAARDSKITDNDDALLKALGLADFDTPNYHREFQVAEPVKNWRGDVSTSTCLWDIAARQLYDKIIAGDEDLKRKWVDNQGTEDLWRDLFDENGVFWEEVGDLAHSLYSQHWQKLAGPFVVPISYFAERGGCMIRPTSWDGDPDDLPDGVWVADAGAEENIIASALPEGVHIESRPNEGEKRVYCLMSGESLTTTAQTWSAIVSEAQRIHRVTDAALHAKAVEYAKNVCSEYASWCEGDVWGIVVEHFRLEGDNWEPVESDSCWGFIGSDWAKRSLKEEYFDPAVERLRAGE